MTADTTPENLTPTLSTGRVRDLYSWAFAWRTDDGDGETDLSRVREQNRAEFDRWLVVHDVEVARKALTDAADAMPLYLRGTFGGNWASNEAYAWLRARAEQIGENRG